jgi:hypothetical protein
MEEDEDMSGFDRALNWMAAFCVGYVIGVSVAALVVFYWRA